MLEVENVSVSYGRHRALEGTSIKIGKGEICVILGANGAGKSTVVKTIAGMVHAEAGSRVVMNGKPITGMKPHRIVEEGIALVPEGRGIFGDLTVAENLQLGAFAHRARRDEAETLRLIYSLFPRLAERKKQVARTMSGGEQQMVAIGRALMSKPEILMLDEPSLGLSPLLSQELFRSLAEVAKTGVGILLVEQNAKQSLRIAGRGYLIENGHVTGENTAQALMSDPAVVAAYLGGAGKAAGPMHPGIVLPPSMRLPASVEAMGRALGDFAARAGRISQAFVRSMRRDGPLPSAFVGRYDPKAAGDPWQQAAGETLSAAAHAGMATPVRAPVVAADARRLGQGAASLASRATDRLAAHVRTTRLSSPRPSAFAAEYDSGVPPVPRWTGAPVGLVAHGGDDGVARGDVTTSASLNGSHGLIGHNSAGLDDEEPEEHAAEPQPARAAGLSIADLAGRAAEIQALHIAARRAQMRTPPPPRVAWSASPVNGGGTSAAAVRDLGSSPAERGRGTAEGGGRGVDSGEPLSSSAAFEPAAVRDTVGETMPGSIADLVARASTIHSTHVAAGRKRLAAFTIPAASSQGAGHKKNGSASGKRKKHKET